MAVTQTFTGDANQLNRELDKINAAYAKLEAQVARAADASEKSAKSHESSVSSAVGKLATLATSYATVTQAVAIYNAALQKQHELQDKTLDVNVRLANAQADLLRNAGNDFDELVKRIDSMRINVSKVALTEAASAAVSGRPQGLTVPQMGTAIESAAGMMREQPGQIGAFTQALMQTMGATGIREGGVAAGMLQSISAQTAIPSAIRVGQFATRPMVAASIQDKADPAQAALQAAAMFAAFTKSGDPMGEQAGTATTGMVTGLGEFFGAKGRQDPGSLAGRIEALQQNEALRKQFLAKPVEGVGIGLRAASEAMFDPASRQYADFRAAMAGIQMTSEPFDALMKRMGTATGPMALGEKERAVATTREKWEIGSHQWRAAEARRIVENAIDVGGQGTIWPGFLGGAPIGQWAARRSFETGTNMWGRDPVDTGESLLQGFLGKVRKGGVTSGERDTEQALVGLLEELRGLRGDVKQGRSQAMAGAATDQPSRHREN